MEREREPLGRAKAESFGNALRAAVRAEFGSAKAFAAAIGVSEGRVSQVTNGPEEVNAQTLAKVLSGFSTGSLRERVHAAWVAEFAPLPDGFYDAAEPDRLLREIDGFWRSGNPKRALQIAEKRLADSRDAFLWQELAERVALINLRLSRPGAALRVLDSMEARAREDERRLDLLTALWMRSSAIRNVEGVRAKQLEEAHARAVELASSWEPKGAEECQRWRARKMELQRDFALHALAVSERSGGAGEALVYGLSSADRAVAMAGEGPALCLGLEVRARLEVATGQLFKAEDTLDDAEARAGGEVHELREKVRMTRARIALARGEKDVAASELQSISDECMDRCNLHHHRVADQLLSKLWAGL